jgi:predicted RNA-binding protein with PUA-like domain
MQYWLMKTEPDVFSIDDLIRKKRSGWDGVRNYQARNFMRDGMKLGDLVFFYHSNAEPPGIVGLAKVSKLAHPDPTQFDSKSEYFDPKAKMETPTWMQVEVEFVEKFPTLISLDQLKAQKKLRDMPLVKRGNRLSVMPISQEHANFILQLKKQL